MKTAVLLIDGNKTGEKRFYKKMIPHAEKIFVAHLKRLEEEDG